MQRADVIHLRLSVLLHQLHFIDCSRARSARSRSNSGRAAVGVFFRAEAVGRASFIAKMAQNRGNGVYSRVIVALKYERERERALCRESASPSSAAVEARERKIAPLSVKALPSPLPPLQGSDGFT